LVVLIPPSGGVAERRSLRGGHDVEAPFAQAVALALEGDHGGVVDEPVDEHGGEHGVAEDLAPLLEADEVGYLPLERSAADLLFTLVSRR
jgi:hypothetical protein